MVVVVATRLDLAYSNTLLEIKSVVRCAYVDVLSTRRIEQPISCVSGMLSIGMAVNGELNRVHSATVKADHHV